MKLKNIEVPVAQITALRDRWHIQKLSLFGSVLRDDLTPKSDINILRDRILTEAEVYIRRREMIRFMWGSQFCIIVTI